MPIQLTFRGSDPGWQTSLRGQVRIWFKGYCTGSWDEFVSPALRAIEEGRPDALGVWLSSVVGHFAVAFQSPGLTVAAVDQVRSIPLFYCEDENHFTVSPDAERLVEVCGLEDLDGTSLLAMAMAGYTVGNATAYDRLYQLRPGEYVVAHGSTSASVRRYSCYSPWLIDDASEEEFHSRLGQVSQGILERLAESVDGRTVVVPLSAGLDSRFVASGLKEVGYTNVKCFAYGKPGNHEARSSREIADRLDFPWRFVPFGRRDQAKLFNSQFFADYRLFASGLCCTPFSQDLLAIRELRDDGWLPDDAVVVNGNTGDFISGGHIPVSLGDSEEGSTTGKEREERILESILSKHFRLWLNLATAPNDAVVKQLIRTEWEQANILPATVEAEHAVYEFTEFQDRQAKYVVNGQRVYEFVGYDWRLPLWDVDFLRFWERVPRELKIGQRLYRSFLRQQNWGDVWRKPEAQVTVVPKWLKPVLKATRGATLLTGPKEWMPLERRYFAYWLDVVNNYAIVPYSRVVSDDRGSRNAISWHTEDFFRAKGFPWPRSGVT